MAVAISKKTRVSLLLWIVLMIPTATIAGKVAQPVPDTQIEGIPFRLALKGNGVTAIFSGEYGWPAPRKATRYVHRSPLEKSIRSLIFVFAGDPEHYQYFPRSPVSDISWQLNVFSPDKLSVILPQDDAGLWHRVPIADLKAYLSGHHLHAKVLHVSQGRLAGERGPEPEIPYELTFSIQGNQARFEGVVAGSYPLDYGVDRVVFSFEDDVSEYIFKPEGQLLFSDWRFDVFSPAGDQVLLLQDHYGPYHVVDTENLRDYLLKKTGPSYELNYTFPGSSVATVLSNGGWLSTGLVSFSATCCGATKELAFDTIAGEELILY